ncbi:MAG: hypothetical protein ACOCXG_02705 [Nanoarchaeota archaeon]
MKKINQKNQKTSEIIAQIKDDLTGLIELNTENTKSLDKITREDVEKKEEQTQQTPVISYDDIVIKKKIIMPYSTKRTRTFFGWLFNNKFN